MRNGMVMHVLQKLDGYSDNPLLLKGLGTDFVEMGFHPTHQKVRGVVLDGTVPLQFNCSPRSWVELCRRVCIRWKDPGHVSN